MKATQSAPLLLSVILRILTVLFEPEIGLGTRVGHGLSVEASWVHMSHAQLAGKENPGIDNLGFRVNLAL